MASIAEAAASVEAACAQFLSAASPEQRTQAEQFLLGFRKHPQPLPVCQHLLLNSTVSYAKLQALYTVRECLGALWPGLAAEERTELQRLLLQLQTAGAATERYVSEAAAQVLAVHAKHDLLHADGGATSSAADVLLHGATQMLEEPSGAHAEAALRVLSAMLTEFGAPSAGTVGGGLAWSSHARARSAFEERYLAPLCALGMRYLLHARQQPPPMGPAQQAAVSCCAALLSTALGWEFGGIAEAAADGEPRPGLGASVVRPPKAATSWAGVLRTSDLLACVIELHAALTVGGTTLVGGGSAGGGGAGGLMHALQQLIVSLASVSRRVFEPLDAIFQQHASLLLTASATLVATTDQPGGGALPAPSLGDASFMNGCVVLQRFIVCCGAEALLLLPPEAISRVLQLLHTASLHALHTTIALQDARDTDELNGVPVGAVVDASDVLMEAWVSLLCGSLLVAGRPAAIADAAWGVYEVSVQARLHACAQEAAREAEEEVEEGGEDADRERERLVGLATLGRAQLSNAAALLLGRIEHCTTQLRGYCELVATQGAAAASAAGGSAANLASLHEQCDCLVRCAGHLLADEPTPGETLEPPPEAVLAAQGVAAAAGADGAAALMASLPVSRLFEGVVGLLRLQLTAISSYETQPDASPLAAALSPLLGTSLLWFLRRFASTYLMPDEATCSVLAPPYLALWGADTPGASALLTLCVDAAAVYMERWGREEELAAEACHLLVALARLRAPRRGPAQMLAALPSWQRLSAATADPKALRAGSSQRLLLEALCRAAAAKPDSQARESTIRSLVATVPARLAEVAARATGSAGALPPGQKHPGLLRPDALVEIRACCGCLRGVALACHYAETVVVTAESVGQCLPTLLAAAPSFCPSHEPLLPILKVHRDLAQTTIALLPMSHALALAQHCAELVAMYATHAPPPPPAPPAGAGGLHSASASWGAASAKGASAAAEAEEVVRYKQVKTLLQLLGHLASRDEDASSEQQAADELSYTGVLTAALGHVLPCVTPALLEYPKLCAAYFRLLGSYLETRPLAAVTMPPPLYASVHDSIGFGIAHHDANICRGALEAAYEFARRAAQHATHAGPADEMLRQLLGRVAADLLTSRLHPEVVDPAGGNALIALIVAQPAHWQALVASLVGAQPTAEGRACATAAFGALLTTNNVSATLSRPNRQRFRTNLEVMLRTVVSAGLVLPSAA